LCTRHLFLRKLKRNNDVATDSQILIYMEFDEKTYPLQKETHAIIGLCMEVHRILGPGLLEIVYKDALELEFKNNVIPYNREKEYLIEYKGVVLPHRFYADFIVYGSIVLEAKAQKGFTEDFYTRVINYLALSKCKIGLLVNFGENSLRYKRFIL
jgi:GxxExxY protein